MLRRMIRVMLLPIVGAIAVLLFAVPSSAAPRVPNGTPFAFSVDAGELCPFPVTLEGVSPTLDESGGPSQFVRTTLPDGTVILTSPFVLTITNTEDPENLRSATFNISGPTFQSGNKLTLTGSAIVLLFNLGPDFPDPGILATNGRGTIVDGVFNEATFKGHTIDVCQQLS
jgi:hypothetical protein